MRGKFVIGWLLLATMAGCGRTPDTSNEMNADDNLVTEGMNAPEMNAPEMNAPDMGGAMNASQSDNDVLVPPPPHSKKGSKK